MQPRPGSSPHLVLVELLAFCVDSHQCCDCIFPQQEVEVDLSLLEFFVQKDGEEIEPHSFAI